MNVYEVVELLGDNSWSVTADSPGEAVCVVYDRAFHNEKQGGEYAEWYRKQAVARWAHKLVFGKLTVGIGDYASLYSPIPEEYR